MDSFQNSEIQAPGALDSKSMNKASGLLQEDIGNITIVIRFYLTIRTGEAPQNSKTAKMPQTIAIDTHT